jgi:hypothetical protein
VISIVYTLGYYIKSIMIYCTVFITSTNTILCIHCTLTILTTILTILGLGVSSQVKSHELMKVSPTGKYIAIVGSSGYIHILCGK